MFNFYTKCPHNAKSHMKFGVLYCETALEIDRNRLSQSNRIAVIFQLFTADQLMDFTEIIQP